MKAMGEAKRRKLLDPSWAQPIVSDRAAMEQFIIDKKGIVLIVQSPSADHIIAVKYGQLSEKYLEFANGALDMASQKSIFERATVQWIDEPIVMILCHRESYLARAGGVIPENEQLVLSCFTVDQLNKCKQLQLPIDALEMAESLALKSVRGESITCLFLDVPIVNTDDDSPVLSTMVCMVDKESVFDNKDIEFKDR
jgi:hypothetical protein